MTAAGFLLKVDFTKCQGLFCVLGIVIFVTGIITTIVLSFKYVSYSSTLHFSSLQHICFLTLTLFAVADPVASHALCSSGSHRLHYGECAVLLNVLFPSFCCVLNNVSVFAVPCVPHTAADRKQEALHQSRGVRVRRPLPLRRHHPDLPFPAADYRRLHQISLQEYSCRIVLCFLKPFALVQSQSD